MTTCRSLSVPSEAFSVPTCNWRLLAYNGKDVCLRGYRKPHYKTDDSSEAVEITVCYEDVDNHEVTGRRIYRATDIMSAAPLLSRSDAVAFSRSSPRANNNHPLTSHRRRDPVHDRQSVNDFSLITLRTRRGEKCDPVPRRNLPL